ncbi:PREDICTED: fibroblast growth factor receptor 2-like isoform X1 [Branchiostoma belcheri]|uniref:receptor protein-tyrosine kinase n=1 Tax=Branchiostoma belcheri TaxID=7741 RepID=A0A6P5AMT4_BRABE|nr:PREDICTED: fibroblast growth factor receptor 2-like isoform X1 [Branchiostoma belcheri]
MYMPRNEASSSAALVTLLFLVVSCTGEWSGDPSFSKGRIRVTWDGTNVDDSFVKYVVQLYQVNGTIPNCDAYLPWEPKTHEIPRYELKETTFSGLQPGTFYCRNCTIVTKNGTKSCGILQPIRTVLINSTDQDDRIFNSTSVTDSTIRIKWLNFTEQSRRSSFLVLYFLYYKLDISPREYETDTPQVFWNETDLEAEFAGLTPGKEYQIQLETVGINNVKNVRKGYSLEDSMMRYITLAIISTDPSPVKQVSVLTTDSTSVTLNLVPPTEGSVDLFQLQASSPHHTSPLIDVPLPKNTPTGVTTTIYNLQPRTVYNLTVTTVANGKTGKARFATFKTEAVHIDPKLVGSLTSVLVVVVIAAAICAVQIVKRLRYKLDPTQLFKEVLEDIVGSEKMEPWLKNRRDLFLDDLIGEGEFGHVRKGVLREEGQQAVIVAAKTLRVDRANEMTYRDFAKEASLLVEVNDDGGHVNIIGLIGLVIDGVKKKDPRYILVEYAEPGELLWYLLSVQNSRHQDGFPPGLGRQLTEVAMDIARGMLELKRRRITHRDLACRNIVLCSPDGQAGRLVAKISDFGLARDVYVTTQYMRHPLTNLLLPIKWMAIESLIEGVYSCKSDMWGFGVVLWEIATLGECLCLGFI